MYTSLNGMTPLTNKARLAYDVAGLGDFMSEIHRQRSGAPAPTRGWHSQSPHLTAQARRRQPLRGLGDFDFSGIISSLVKTGSDIGTSLIQKHYAPDQNASQPLYGAPAQIIPTTQIQYLPVPMQAAQSSGSNKTLLIVGGVAAAAVIGFLVMRRKG